MERIEENIEEYSAVLLGKKRLDYRAVLWEENRGEYSVILCKEFNILVSST